MTDILKTVKEHCEGLGKALPDLQKIIDASLRKAKQEHDSYAPKIEVSKKELVDLEEKKKKARHDYEQKTLELEKQFIERTEGQKRILVAEAQRVEDKEREAIKKLEAANTALNESKHNLALADESNRTAGIKLEAAEKKQSENNLESNRLSTEKITLEGDNAKLKRSLVELEKGQAEYNKAKEDLNQSTKRFLSQKQTAEENLKEASSQYEKAAEAEARARKLHEEVVGREKKCEEREQQNEKDKANNLAKEKNLDDLRRELKKK